MPDEASNPNLTEGNIGQVGVSQSIAAGTQICSATNVTIIVTNECGLASTCNVPVIVGVLIKSPLAQWTFEVSQPSATEPPNIPLTGVTPEFGTGTASALHLGATTYSSPAGNGSSHSLSSSNWMVGDYYQFACSTLGASGISVAWDQVSSATGPGAFQFQYSLDGINFSNYGAAYQVGDNGALSGPTTYWNSETYNSTTHYPEDLTSIASLNNAQTVYFRVVDVSTNSSSGGALGQFGADRVDNFTVSGLVLRGAGNACDNLGISRADSLWNGPQQQSTQRHCQHGGDLQLFAPGWNHSDTGNQYADRRVRAKRHQ